MKKIYISPDIILLDMDAESDVLTVSGGVSDDNKLDDQGGGASGGDGEKMEIKIIKFGHSDYDNW